MTKAEYVEFQDMKTKHAIMWGFIEDLQERVAILEEVPEEVPEKKRGRSRTSK